MRIRQLELGDDGRPDKITAELTRDEALYLATILGKQNGIQANEVMPGGETVSAELYDSLTGELFNRYWEGGALEAFMERGEAA